MNTRQQYFFLLQVAGCFFALAFAVNLYFYGVVILILACLPFKKSRTKLIHYWQQLGIKIGHVVSPIVLSIMYYLFLTPLAYLRRLTGSDELMLRRPEKSTLMTVELTHPVQKFDDLW